MLYSSTALIALLPFASAHFQVTWPTNRGFVARDAIKFPCGGFDSVKTPRTDFPINNGPIQLTMEHPQTNVAVYIAIGDNPNGAFNTVIRRQFTVEVLGNFCVGGIGLPSGLNVTDGTPATIQVVTNGDPEGGLYQCADVTLRTASLSQSDYDSHCKNQTGSKVTAENVQGNPNETNSDHSGHSSHSSSAGAAATTSSRGFAAHQTAATWAMGAMGIAGLALL